MNTKKITKKKSFKKQMFETVYTRLNDSLLGYKEVIGEKKLNRFLRKTSKELAGEINKETKQAKRRKEKLARKAAKPVKK